VDSAVFRKMGEVASSHYSVFFVRGLCKAGRWLTTQKSWRTCHDLLRGKLSTGLLAEYMRQARHYTCEETMSIHGVVSRQLDSWWATARHQWVWMGAVRYIYTEEQFSPPIWGYAGAARRLRFPSKGKKGKGKGKKGKGKGM
jgi:hypothetical protein